MVSVPWVITTPSAAPEAKSALMRPASRIMIANDMS